MNDICPHAPDKGFCWHYVADQGDHGRCGIQSGDNDIDKMKYCAIYDPKNFKSQRAKKLAKERRDNR